MILLMRFNLVVCYFILDYILLVFQKEIQVDLKEKHKDTQQEKFNVLHLRMVFKC